MNSEIITSRDNVLAKRTRAVRDGRERDLIFIEGVRLCEEAARASLTIEDILYTKEFEREERAARLLEFLSRKTGRSSTVSESVLASITDTKTPQGIIVLARRPGTDRERLDESNLEEPLMVILHGVNNPSNAGAILRVAEAAGASAVIATEGTTDLFSPKALRGAMGSSFRLPIWAGARFREAVKWCAEREIRTVSTDPRAETLHTDVDWRGARAVIVGGEAGGLTTNETAATDFRIKIPMRAPVESLNVAVSLAVVLYEAARQRGAFPPPRGD